jgi:hypothetical protein
LVDERTRIDVASLLADRHSVHRYLLSRTVAYSAVRVAVALLGGVFSSAWLVERAGLIGSDPFASVSNALIDHPFTVAAAFALLATLAHYGLPAGASLPGASALSAGRGRHRMQMRVRSAHRSASSAKSTS